MRLVIGLIVGLSLSSPASAASWVFVGNCGADNQVRAYSYDAGSVKRRGGKILVQVRGDYSRSAGSATHDARMLWSIDCANRTIEERTRTEYRADRSVAARFKQSTGSMGINADSIAEKLHSKVCA